MTRFAIAYVLRERDIPKTTGDGISAGIAHGGNGITQIRAIVDGMNSFRNGMTTGPLSRRRLRLVIVTSAALIQGQIAEDFVVSRGIQHEPHAARGLMARIAITRRRQFFFGLADLERQGRPKASCNRWRSCVRGPRARRSPRTCPVASHPQDRACT